MPCASGCSTPPHVPGSWSCRSPTAARARWPRRWPQGGGAVPVDVHGPTGEPVGATLAVRGPGGGPTTVLVELADVCGLGRLPGGAPAPLTASSRGLGEALRAALDLEPAELVVGVGGSASTDGGAGMLAALGARLLDADGLDLPDGGAALADLARLDLTGLDPRLATTRLVLAADVDSPLLGPTGAAAVFGPQKGATAGGRHGARGRARPLGRGRDDGASGAQDRRLARHPHISCRGRGRPAGSASPCSPCWAPNAAPVSTSCSTSSASTTPCPAPTSSSPARARSTPRPWRARPWPASRGRARAHGIPVVAVCGRCDLDDAGLAALGCGGGLPAHRPRAGVGPGDGGRSRAAAAQRRPHRA